MQLVNKKMINGSSDVNQLVPIKYGWAYTKYKNACANTWFPQEVNMKEDIALWRTQGGLTPAERRIVEYNLGFFTTADSLAANNIVLGTYRHITAPEARLFLLIQGAQEAIHTDSYAYIVQSLGLDEETIFSAYLSIPCIKDKDDFLMPFINRLTDPTFCTGSLISDQDFLEALIVFSCIMEGLFFYVGFTQILSFGRRNMLTGMAEQYQYIMRDEALHCNFGIDVVNTIKHENPQIWTKDFIDRIYNLFNTALHLEYRYAEETMPQGISGLNCALISDYLRFLGNRRLLQIGLDPIFGKVENPFPWMSEISDLKKEKNFFETRVTDYQTGGALTWE